MDINNRTITFTVKGNTYTASYPTVGQFFDMESNKVVLSKGQFGGMLDAGTFMSFDAIQNIGIVAFIKTMCPQLIKDLKVEKIEDIDLIDFKELVETYNQQIKPWFDNWYKLYTAGSDEKK
jgi:hypothetical protein